MPILDVSTVLEKLSPLPLETRGAGEVVLAQGRATGKLLVMKEGAVEVVKDGVRIDEVREPGAVFGEISALLDQPHGAEVRTLEPSTFYVADGRTILRVDPTAALYVAMALARRLDAVNRHLLEARARLDQAEAPKRVLDAALDDIGRSLHHEPPH